MKSVLKSIFMMVIIVGFNVESGENVYTFHGNYSYADVLNIMAINSKRSVLGDTIALKIVRNFNINEKRFTVAIDQVDKNLYTDGYKLYVDTTCFYIKPLCVYDTSRKEKEKIQYKVYLPFKKRYMVTDDYEKYLNATQIDYEDSVKNEVEKREKVYKINIEILGMSSDTILSRGVDVGAIGINISYDILNAIKALSLTVNVKNLLTEDNYNFYRNISVNTNKDTSTMVFGSEERLINSVITNNDMVSTNYETVNNGLTVKISGKFMQLQYRINNSNIIVPCYSDNVSICQSDVTESNRTVKWKRIKFKNNVGKRFYLFVKFTKTFVIKEVD